MIDRRVVVAAVALAAVVGLFFLLRPDEDEPRSPPRATGPATTPEFQPLPAQTQTRPVVRWRIDARDGRLDRRTVPKGAEVTIVVVAGVADRVHVHGYDLTARIGPGKPQTIFLRAAVAGRFEIELEEADRPIGQLTVTP